MTVVEHSKVHPKTVQEVLPEQEEPVSSEDDGPIRSEPLKGEKERGDWLSFYCRGERLVPVDDYEVLPFEMKLLHDKVVSLGNYRKRNAPKQFIVKVPVGYHFVTEGSAGKFALRFEDIFHLFHMIIISPSLVRLWALYLAKENRRLNNHICAVIDPFHLHENNGRHMPSRRKIIIDFLVNAMVSHKEIPYLLVTFWAW